MKKCPKCEMNWIEDNEELCSVCLQEMKPVKAQIHETSFAYFHETFTFKSESCRYDGKYGFEAYNSKGEHVGIVFMTDDKRIKAYGYCELHFFPQYRERYGEWHRIKSHGNRIAWDFLCNQLKFKNEYTCYID